MPAPVISGGFSLNARMFLSTRKGTDKLRKQIIFIVIVAVLAGTLGFAGGWYKFVKAPVLKVQKETRLQQEEMQKMTRHGEITGLTGNGLTLLIDKSGDGKKGEQKYRTNEYTSIQVGMQFVNKSGEPADLTQYFKKGDYVDLLVKDGQAVLIHREARKDDPNATEQPTGASVAPTQQPVGAAVQAIQ